MPTVIRTEGLGKRYLIGHQTMRGFDTLRDLIANRLRFSSDANQPVAKEEFWAVRDVAFEIRESERVGIIGRNGAGKSTLLKLLSRITEPTEGRIRIRGRVASLLEVGTGFHPELTGRENIFLNGAILGMSHAEILLRFDEIVDFAEIEQFLDTPVKRYSSGMYVRLAFAVAAHLEPELLFIDEVLAVGDIAFQRKCLGKMKHAADMGRTVLFVSHNLTAIEQLCDRVLLFDHGRLVQDGEPGDVLRSYLSLINNDGAAELGEVRDAGNQVYCTEDGNIQVLRVETTDEQEGVRTVFDMDESITIRCWIRLLVEQSNLHFYARVFSVDGLQVFATADWDVPGMAVSCYQPGDYLLRIVIPTPLLNAGTYTLALDGVDPSKQFLFRTGTLISWKIRPVGGAGGMESVNRAGVIRPLLDWQIRSGSP